VKAIFPPKPTPVLPKSVPLNRIVKGKKLNKKFFKNGDDLAQ